MMSLQDYFFELTGAVTCTLRSSEFLTCWFNGEESDFVRLNKNRVRQAGHVLQLEIVLQLIDEDRIGSEECTLSGDLGTDMERLESAIHHLRMQLAKSLADPYLNFNHSVRNSESVSENVLPERSDAIADIVAAGDGLDLVGFLASGKTYRGFANSLGQRNWYSKPSFNFDWSCYLLDDKAVKSRYAGYEWEPRVLSDNMTQVRVQLEKLRQASKKLSPGKYRVYLAPAAVAEMMALLSWGGFGLKEHKTKQTPLIKLIEEKRAFDPSVTVVEDNLNGLAPNFTREGFIKPDRVPLINQGKYAESLVSARSAKEYGTSVNASHEVPQSLVLGPGELEMDNILMALDTGIFVSNLWYSNYSDRNDCRITGMTRYACFWVENGRFQAPIEAMRFDESLYLVFGNNLIDLTRQCETIHDTDTYERRSLASMRLPGLLVKDFTLTL